MNKIIFFMLIFFFSTTVYAENECVSGVNSKGKSGIEKLGTSYDFSTSTRSGYDIDAHLNSVNNNLQVGDSNIVDLNINNMPYGAKPNYFWKDSCSGRISSLNDDCTKVELNILRDIESDCRLQVEVQDGLGHSKIVTLQYEVTKSNGDYDYKLEVSPKYTEGEFDKPSIFNLSLKHNKPAYDKTVTLNKACYYNNKLEWSDSFTYAPGYDKEHEWDYTPYSGYGLRRCELSIELDGDIDISNNSATVFIHITDPNPPPSDNKDIYLSEERLDKATVYPGDQLRMYVNQGFTGTSPNHFVSSLGYFLSTDTNYSADDKQLSRDRSGLNNSEPVDDESHLWTIPSTQTPGKYFILFVADYDKQHQETNENNNIKFLPVEIMASNFVDLLPKNATLIGSEIGAGKSQTFVAVVANQGNTTASSGGKIRFYRSNDAIITPSDTVLATQNLPAIAANSQVNVSQPLTAPSVKGTYWLGACVETATTGTQDTVANNNCTEGFKFTVVDNAPDLTVTQVTVPSALEVGKTVALNATVFNQGNESSAATTSVAFYASADNVVSTNDQNLGEVNTLALGVKGSRQVTANVTFTQAGQQWLFACVRPVATELQKDLSSNCSAAQAITVQPATQVADLTVLSSTLDSASVDKAEQVKLSVTVKNTGDAASRVGTVHFYRSADADVNTRDNHIASASLSALTAGGSKVVERLLVAPTEPGDYWFGACVAAQSGERDVSNNCSPAAKLTVKTAHPELTISQFSVPSQIDAESYVYADATVSNTGGLQAAATNIAYYASTDAQIDLSDSKLVQYGLPAIAAKQAHSIKGQIRLMTAGQYWIYACVAPVSGEQQTGLLDNCSTPTAVMVKDVNGESKSDLEITATQLSASRVAENASFNLTATVKNSGEATSERIVVQFYQSVDATISTDDKYIASTPYGTLVTGAQTVLKGSLIAPESEGTYWFGACVVVQINESNVANNCSAANKVDVYRDAPELSISQFVLPDQVTVSESVLVNTAVRNTGTQASTATVIAFYVSTDQTIDLSDSKLAEVTVPAIATNREQPLNASIKFSTAGQQWVYACVRPVANEQQTDATSNCSSPSVVTVKSVVIPPVLTGVSDNYTLSENNALSVTTNDGVLANDQVTNATVELAVSPKQGSLLLRSDGSFVYTSDTGYSGDDTFAYRISRDGISSQNIVVTLSVKPTSIATNDADGDGVNDVSDTEPNNSSVASITADSGDTLKIALDDTKRLLNTRIDNYDNSSNLLNGKELFGNGIVSFQSPVYVQDANAISIRIELPDAWTEDATVYAKAKNGQYQLVSVQSEKVSGKGTLLLSVSDGATNDSDGEVNGLVSISVAVAREAETNVNTSTTSTTSGGTSSTTNNSGNGGPGSINIALLLLFLSLLIISVRQRVTMRLSETNTTAL